MRKLPILAVVSITLLPETALAAPDHVKVDSPDISNESVDQNILSTVQTQLPEGRNVDASFLNPSYTPYLTLNQRANVSLTFLDEGAGYKNSLGWISFGNGAFDGLSKSSVDTNGSGTISLSELDGLDNVEYGWLFPNASKQGAGGTLQAGDTVRVGNGTLEAGTNISFFLGQNGAKNNNRVKTDLIDGDRQVFYGVDFLNPESTADSTFSSTEGTTRHVAMMFADENKEQVIMGFEDLNRVDPSSNDWSIRSDEDFNDAVFIVQSDPAEAFGDSNIATAPVPDMGKGAMGLMLLAGLGWLARNREEKGNKNDNNMDDNEAENNSGTKNA